MRRHEYIYCRACKWTGERVIEPSAMPDCPRCSSLTRIDFTKWDHAPHTDVFGSEQVSQVLDGPDGRPLRYRSTREKDRIMRSMGYEPAGDRIKGARSQVTGSEAERPYKVKKNTARRGGSDDGAGHKPAA